MDEFCSWTACLHGAVQILLQIAMVFMSVRANFLCCKCSPRNSNVYVALIDEDRRQWAFAATRTVVAQLIWLK